jgi:hypothetical protein
MYVTPALVKQLRMKTLRQGEDNTEHRQTGKNNMYDSASRVAMILSGPGIKAMQEMDNLASLNDVFPTVLSMAGVPLPAGLAGSSLLPLVNGQGDPTRKKYITAQYHSVFSVTGTFMIRQGQWKLIVYGKNKFGSSWPDQFFDLQGDPWELHDLGTDPTHQATMDRLRNLLRTEMDIDKIDTRAKLVQKALFERYGYLKHNASAGCQALFTNIFGLSFNKSDAERVERWLGKPCPFKGPAPPDPSCHDGIKDQTGTVCCAASCGVCAHPSSECSRRPGGSRSCCPSIVNKTGLACAVHAAPCVLGSE